MNLHLLSRQRKPRDVINVRKPAEIKKVHDQLEYTTQVNSTFRVRRLASSEVISQVLFTSISVNYC